MRQLLLLLAVSIFSLTAQAQVSATIDRFTIPAGGSARLTLDTDQQFVNSPDLSPLYDDFQIMGSKKMTISSKKTKGDKQFSARWQVLLRPKRSGTLTIPALQVGSERSPELIITVAGRKNRSNQQTPLNDSDNPEFVINQAQSTFELVADSTELYVSSQLTLTLRLLFRGQISGKVTLPTPQVPEAVVKVFGNQEQRQSVRRGQVIQVIEQKYLVFPLQPGKLTIAEQIFSTQHNGLNIQVISLPLSIDVLKPAFQKNRGYWLPASNVTLEDNLQSPFAMEVGQAIDRVITMTAEGITAESLPAISPLRNELASIEIQNIELFEEMTEQGIIATRQETVRITPYERGEVTLKTVSIPWWNTSQDRSNDALLESKILHVAAASAPAFDSNPVTEEYEEPSNDPVQEDKADIDFPIEYLIWAAGIIFSLGLAYFAFSQRHRFAINLRLPSFKKSTIEQSENPEDIAFQALTMACEQNNTMLAQQAVILWAQHYWAGYAINNNDDLCQLAGSETFDILINDLEDHIDEESDEWQGDLLLEACSMLRSLNQEVS